MSMVSYAAGARYLSLIGGVCLSFYDWYCDLPPSSPQTWGEQTDVPESADWYNSGFLILWGSNVPQTRTPDAHFYTEARYRGAKSAVICAGLFRSREIRRHLAVGETGNRRRAGHGHGPCHPASEFHVDRQVDYFVDYMQALHRHADAGALVEKDGRLVPDRFLRASDLDGGARTRPTTPNGRRWLSTRTAANWSAPNGSVGFRWGEKGKWNLEAKRSDGSPVDLHAVPEGPRQHELVDVAFPYFGNIAHEHFASSDHASILQRRIPATRLTTDDGEVLVASVYDLFLANYGVDRGFGGDNVAQRFRRQRSLHAGLGGNDHRRLARQDHSGGARVRAQRRKDQGPFDGDHRRRR